MKFHSDTATRVLGRLVRRPAVWVAVAAAVAASALVPDPVRFPVALLIAIPLMSREYRRQLDRNDAAGIGLDTQARNRIDADEPLDFEGFIRVDGQRWRQARFRLTGHRLGVRSYWRRKPLPDVSLVGASLTRCRRSDRRDRWLKPELMTILELASGDGAGFGVAVSRSIGRPVLYAFERVLSHPQEE